VSGSCIVVACRMPGALRYGERPVEVLERFGTLASRAAVLGGTVVQSSYDGVVFSWEEGQLPDAVSLATAAANPAAGDPRVWACGIASGTMHTAHRTAPGAKTPFEWGEVLAVATALARLAKPREVLVHLSIPLVASRELLTDRARVGKVGGLRIRGFRLNTQKPWRAIAAADVARMVDPPLVAREVELELLVATTGVVSLRADSGMGGSRVLAEVALATKPGRSIVLTPFAPVHEPLGALRRAMALVAATERITLPHNLHPVLDRLLGAQGITIDEAGLLLAHQLHPTAEALLPSILLDDATDIDEPSVDACGRAIELLGGAVRVVARIDSMSQLPRSLARFSEGESVTLGRLDIHACEAIAGGCTGEALEPHARRQWARRGGGSPLAVIEAVAAGVSKGELLWTDDSLAALKRVGGEEIGRPVAYWIARRAEGLREASRDVLIALAHLGGEASVAEVFDVVANVAPEVDVAAELVFLRHGRWIRESRPGTFVLLHRAQREAILEFSRNDHSHNWRLAVATVLERADGTLRKAEAAQHAARAGNGQLASRLAMAAARAAAQVGLEEAASALAVFAGVQDPDSADLDLGALPLDEDATVAGALELDELLEEVKLDVPSIMPPVPRPPSEAPDAGGEAPESKSPISYQLLLDAARDLRETRWVAMARRSLVDGADRGVQRRGLLALARAYAAEGRSAEALIHGLDALARMREEEDGEGARTCLLFLASLYEQTARPTEAGQLKDAAQAAM